MIADAGQFIESWLGWGRPQSVKAQLDGKVGGDSIEVLIFPRVPGLIDNTQSRTITKAWLSIKDKETDSDATENAAWSPTAGARQSVTTTEADGRGWIYNASEASPILRFDVTAVNSALLTARKLYYFDVQVLMSDGSIYTVERGTFTFVKGITAAVS